MIRKFVLACAIAACMFAAPVFTEGIAVAASHEYTIPADVGVSYVAVLPTATDVVPVTRVIHRSSRSTSSPRQNFAFQTSPAYHLRC